MSVIDFHSHILPGIDDGSKHMEMSKQMLKLYVQQGINTIVATPHFYASSMTLERFLERRETALLHLQTEAGQKEICLLPGAEVAFFPGMGHAEGIEKLTIADTSLLLLEMPFRSWGRNEIREVEKLLERGMTPIMAHLERFYPYQRDKRIFRALYSLPVLVQVNAEALLNWKTRRLVLRLLKEGSVHLLGSDCHNTDSRPPNLEAGRKIIEKKLGDSYLMQIDRLGEEVLG